MTNGYDYIKINGLETEEQYPYQGDDEDCSRDSKKSTYKVTEYKVLDQANVK